MKNQVEKWLDLYRDGEGVTDSPTRGLIGELIFRDLMPEEIQRRLVKGTFEYESHNIEADNNQHGRSSKYQFDWLLLKDIPSNESILTLSGIHFGVFDKDDVLAAIEIKAGDYIGEKSLTSEEFANHQKKRCLGKKWVYITFGESLTVYKKFKNKELDLTKIENADGKYFCLYGIGGEKQCETTIENIKEVGDYLLSF